jgi:L,D-transpeptidase YcbB
MGRFGRMGTVSVLGLLLMLGTAGRAALAGGEPVDPEGMAVQQLLANADSSPAFLAGVKTRWNRQLDKFYRHRSYRPAWLEQGRPGALAGELLEALRNAEEDGLCAEDYHLDQIEDLLAAPPPPPGLESLVRPEQARLDLLLSDAFMHYFSDLVDGRVDPNRVFDGWQARPRRVDPARLLEFALRSGHLRPLLADLLPPHAGYLALRRALADYRRQWLAGAWPVIPAGATLRSGMRDPRLPLLRQRLEAEGDLAPGAAAGEVFDDATEAALERFQLRHGLAADGVLGQRTRQELNVPITARIQQLELNLERWRWLPKSLGERYILINIADFRLTVVDAGDAVLSMPVVVGTAFRKTPVFSGRLSYLELSPYWNVPPTILREDLLPKVKADPGLLAARHFEIVRWGGEQVVDPAGIDWQQVDAETFPGMLRQLPGPWNPLGRIKFMFPNPYAVYLHDTPDPYLFGREVRTYSSGCIRIQHPFELARYLLAKEADTKLRDLRPQLLPETQQRVDLAEPLPVHILYWTAWVDSDGQVNFRDDVYWRDLDLQLALAPPAPAAESLPDGTVVAAAGMGL